MHPKIQIAFVGRTAHLRCNSIYIPEWIRNGEILPTRSYVLVISPITQKDGGKYFCRGISPDNKTFIGQSQVIVGSML